MKNNKVWLYFLVNSCLNKEKLNTSLNKEILSDKFSNFLPTNMLNSC